MNWKPIWLPNTFNETLETDSIIYIESGGFYPSERFFSKFNYVIFVRLSPINQTTPENELDSIRLKILNHRFLMPINEEDVKNNQHYNLKDKFVDCGHLYLMEYEDFHKRFPNALKVKNLSGISAFDILNRIDHFFTLSIYGAILEITSDNTWIFQYAHPDVLLWDALTNFNQKTQEEKMNEIIDKKEQLKNYETPNFSCEYCIYDHRDAYGRYMDDNDIRSFPFYSNVISIAESDLEALQKELKGVENAIKKMKN